MDDTSTTQVAPQDAGLEIEFPTQIVDVLMAGFLSEAWQRELRELAACIGAQHVGYGYATKNGLVMPFCSTLPMAFIEQYADAQYQSRDPVPLRIAGASAPVVFDKIIRQDAFQEIFVENGKRHGIEAPTLGVPMQGGFGQRAGVAFYGLEIPDDPHHRARLLKEAQRLAQQFHARVPAGTQIF